VLAVPSGILLAATLLLDPLFMFEPMLKGFAAAVLGGLGSLPGAVVGGLLLGLAESLVGAAFGLPFRNSLGFVVIVAVLLLRPEGLLGRPLKERV
jgi:branched-chain amino acid transport system permease protein